MELHITYAPGPVARAFHRDTASRVKLIIGPFGTGKTTSAAWDLIDFASERVLPINGKKKSRFAIVRNTYPELRDTTIKTYLDWFPPAAFGKYNSTEKRFCMRFENKEIELIFKALDSPQDVRDLLSLELTGAHIDEAREIHEDIFKGLLGRIASTTGNRFVFLDQFAPFKFFMVELSAAQSADRTFNFVVKNR